jgi:ankyrin repeat protein
MYCNVDGKTPLHTLFNEVVGAILQCHGDSIDGEARDGQGMTLLHFVAWSSKSEPRICRQYVERRSDSTGVWSRDNEGRSILHLAAQRGNAAMVKYILELLDEPNINCRDQHGRTALSYAAETKRTEVIEMLRAYGGTIRDIDYRGRTILHHAARRGNLAAVKKLVAHGGADDVWSTDKNGATPIQLAYQLGATPVIEFLQELQSTMLENDVVCKSQSRNVLPNFGIGPDTQPQLQRPRTSEDQGTRGTLQCGLIKFLFPGWDRSRLAKIFILAVFATLLWEWLGLSIRLAPV